MESFSLLKYWRGGGGGAAIAAAIRSSIVTRAAAAVIRPSAATTDDGGDDDDGPFFDLVFSALPVDDGSAAELDGEVEEGEFNLQLNSVGSGGAGGGGGGGLQSEGFSPSDDFFFNGKLVPLDHPSFVIAASGSDSKPQFPAVSLLKSATKFRVFLPGLRKPKPTATEPNAASFAPAAAASPKQPPQQQQSRFFVKFKVEKAPIVSLFTRNNGYPGGLAAKTPAEDSVVAVVAAADDKRFSREAVQKYLNMIKPLYVRVSRRHGEKLRLPGEPTPAKEEPEEAATSGVGKGLPVGLRVVRKRLGKSRSAASAIVAEVPPLPPPQRRRDDSLREQQDGIQSAIAHCKRSLTAPDKGMQTTTTHRIASRIP